MALTPSTMLPLETKAPDFNLPDVVSGRMISLKSFEDKKALLAMFICRHYPYVQHLKEEIAIVTENDPQKLKAIKQNLAENAEKYFTCLLQPGIPADNNKAERGLRHIVLKRKISYGSKSQKGADAMAILCSTLLSAWWNKPENFFVAYNQMLTA